MNILTKDPSRYVETAIDEETVVMLLESGAFFSLRDSARTIWQLIDGGRDRDAILSELASSYDAPRDVLACDLDAFLAELRDSGLVAG